MQKTKLSNRIRIVSNQKKLTACPRKNLEFYKNYALKVSKILKKPIFQNFLKWIIKREEIEKQEIKDIQIRLFPFKKGNGKSLAGRCNCEEGVILIFPKKRFFLINKLKNHNKEKVNFYLKCRAIAALIHEILHIKYEKNESKVRMLTKKYFGIFIRHQNPDLSNNNNFNKMLF